LITVHLFIY